jgi:predicted SAM-dependent methyltransferase
MLNLLRHRWRSIRKEITAARTRRLPGGLRLHVGCGPIHLDGWVNIDNRRYPAADYVLDVRDGVPFRDLTFVFAEHFIEHLPLWEAHRFLVACRAALSLDGVLRLSTPNLDWVYRTQYGDNQAGIETAVRNCFNLNTSFRGWGHQFLYNAATLANILRAAGFDRVEFCTYGESRHDQLAGLERHERSPDSSDLPHVLIVEASGMSDMTSIHALTGAQAFLNTLGAS